MSIKHNILYFVILRYLFIWTVIVFPLTSPYKRRTKEGNFSPIEIRSKLSLIPVKHSTALIVLFILLSIKPFKETYAIVWLLIQAEISSGANQ